jgi:hypothetical protein
MQPADTYPFTAERLEIELLMERFARSPRIVQLLSYIARKYFAGEFDQLNELQIAVEVFGRPRDFDRSQDAIARVEAHRLRKKLREYYETEGKDREIQVSLPPGSYIPVFHYRNGATVTASPNGQVSSEDPSAAAAAFDPHPLLLEPNSVPLENPPETPFGPKISPPKKNRKWIVASIGSAVVLTALTGWYRVSHGRPAAPRPPAHVLSASPATIPAGGAVRLLCGYSGPPHIDLLGKAWGADQYFIDGRPGLSPQRFTGRTNDPFLFTKIRTGEFSYAIPLKPGNYELHLFFIESSYGEEMGGGEMSRTFLIRLNGKILFDNFDIIADANGPRIADERVIKDVQPGSDGRLRLQFESERGQPILSAIEIVPAPLHRQLPVRLVMQPASFTDHAGQLWSPDNYFLGGQMSMRRPPVRGTPDPDLFACERAGNFSYAIPADPRGVYGARLYFAETYFGPGGPPNSGIGSRIFNVSCNGKMLLENLDIYKEAGKCRALVKTFHGLRPNAQGKLVFWFDPVVNYASVSAIEIFDESS